MLEVLEVTSCQLRWLELVRSLSWVPGGFRVRGGWKRRFIGCNTPKLAAVRRPRSIETSLHGRIFTRNVLKVESRSWNSSISGSKYYSNA